MKLIFLFVMCASLCVAQQKQVSDTIDYSAFPFDWKSEFVLYKIKQGFTDLPEINKAKLVFKTIKPEEDNVVKFFASLGEKIKIGDTIAETDWDLISKNTLTKGSGHTTSIIKLNTAKNILKYTRNSYDRLSSKQFLIKRTFLILKFTKNEIKIKDLTLQELNRVYFFKPVIIEKY